MRRVLRFGWLLLAMCSRPSEEKRSKGAASAQGALSAPPRGALTTTSPVVPVRASVAPSDAPTPPVARPVRVAFTGDVCLGLAVGTNLDRLRAGLTVSVSDGYPFTHVLERLRSADLLVGNLECVLSLRGKPETGHNPFRCSMGSAEVLKAAGFDRMGVANNHSLDYGRPAYADMLRNLDAAGLAHFGRETFTRQPQAPAIHLVRGIKIGLLAYYWPPDLPLADVKNARPLVNVLFVYMHWGVDDTVEPTIQQRRLARDFIDAGVDVVVGTHAHVVQPTEWYRGKLIAYGLGNFVFTGMTHTSIHRIGATLEVDIASDRQLTHRMAKLKLDQDGSPAWIGEPVVVVAEPVVEPRP